MNNKLTLTLLLSIFILLTGLGSRAQVSGGCLLTPSTATVCAGASITFSSTDAYSTEIWTPSLGTFTTVPGVYGTGTYTAPSTAGTYTLTYNSNTTLPIYPDICTATITVIANTTAPPITGTPAICSGDTVLFTDGLSGGAWNSSNGLIASTDASGNVTGVAPGTAIISYMPGVTCGVAATYAVEIDVPFAIIWGSPAVCGGIPTTLTGWSPGGIWSGGTSGLATIDATSGIVTTYTVTSTSTVTFTYAAPANSCGGAHHTSFAMSIEAPLTSAGTISAATPYVCIGATTTYSESVSGGTFTSDNTAVATVDPVYGTVTGITAGTANISYILTNSCGTLYATPLAITVTPLPNAGTISGITEGCVSNNYTYTSSGDAGGSWSASGGATIDMALGILTTGSSAGYVPITYTVTNGCGTANTSTLVLVDAPPTAISGTPYTCPLTSSILADGVDGGTWSSSDPTIALPYYEYIEGITGGNVTITYTLTNGCGTNYATYGFTVYPAANASTISGSSPLCSGTTAIFAYGIGADHGTWSNDVGGDATVDLSSGVVTGISPGTATITYNAINIYGCTAYTTYTVTVIGPVPPAGPISGGSAVCSGSTITLSGYSSGGSWSSSDPTIGSIDAASGVAGGIALGIVTITYTTTNFCGSSTATAALNIDGVLTPTITPMYGTSFNYCIHTVSTTFTGTPSGGTWSTAGLTSAYMTGSTFYFANAGLDVVDYWVSNSCGSYEATQDIYIEDDETPTISGTNPELVCVGDTFVVSAIPWAISTNTFGISETFTTPGSFTSIISEGSNTYGIIGLSAGSEIITYAYTNVCNTYYATAPVWVGPPQSHTLVYTSFPPTVTTGNSYTLTHNTVPGATSYSYSSDNPVFATVSSAGILNIIGTSGIANIKCSANNGCGSVTVTHRVSIP